MCGLVRVFGACSDTESRPYIGDHDGDYSLMYINLSERYYIDTSVLFPTWTKVIVMSVCGLGCDIVSCLV